jgi:hypothetical protein
MKPRSLVAAYKNFSRIYSIKILNIRRFSAKLVQSQTIGDFYVCSVYNDITDSGYISPIEWKIGQGMRQ